MIILFLARNAHFNSRIFNSVLYVHVMPEPQIHRKTHVYVYAASYPLYAWKMYFRCALTAVNVYDKILTVIIMSVYLQLNCWQPRIKVHKYVYNEKCTMCACKYWTQMGLVPVVLFRFINIVNIFKIRYQKTKKIYSKIF